MCVVCASQRQAIDLHLIQKKQGSKFMAWHGMAWHGMAWHGMARQRGEGVGVQTGHSWRKLMTRPCAQQDSLQQGRPAHSSSIAQRNWHGRAEHSTAEHSTAQHSTAQHSTAQHSTAQHSTAQHSTAQHSTAQHSTSTAQLSLLWQSQRQKQVRRNRGIVQRDTEPECWSGTLT